MLRQLRRVMRKKIAIWMLGIAVFAVSLGWLAINNDDAVDAQKYGPENYASPQIEALVGSEYYKTEFEHNHSPITCTEMPFCTEVWYHRFDSQLEEFMPWPEGEPTPEPTSEKRTHPTLEPATPVPAAPKPG